MNSVPACVLDANVLYPAQLRDLLMRLAVAGLFRPHWTDEIHDEWTRNVLADHPDLEPEALRRTRRLMERALPAAQVTGFERRIRGLELPDPDDRHVLAAAIEVGADLIVTFNLGDFPAEALQARGILAAHPDALVSELIGVRSGDVLAVMRQHRTSLRKPPKSPAEYVAILKRAGLTRAAQFASKYADEL